MCPVLCLQLIICIGMLSVFLFRFFLLGWGGGGEQNIILTFENIKKWMFTQKSSVWLTYSSKTQRVIALTIKYRQHFIDGNYSQFRLKMLKIWKSTIFFRFLRRNITCGCGIVLFSCGLFWKELFVVFFVVVIF